MLIMSLAAEKGTASLSFKIGGNGTKVKGEQLVRAYQNATTEKKQLSETTLQYTILHSTNVLGPQRVALHTECRACLDFTRRRFLTVATPGPRRVVVERGGRA